MSNKLYVGNLDHDTTDAELIEFFSSYGKVHTAKVKLDSVTGEPWGYGFVVMEDDSVAHEIINTSKGKKFRAKDLEVRLMTQVSLNA